MPLSYLDAERTEPAVILLECWSTKTWSPLPIPISAKWVSSFSSTLTPCFLRRSWRNSESFITFLWLKEQHIPMSVGMGLNSLEQFIFLPCQTHFFRRYSDPEILSFLWQGRFECHRRLKRLLKFLPISFTGKLACMIFFKIFSICWKFFLLFLSRNKSIIGNLVFLPWSFDVLILVFVWGWHEL